MMKISVMLRDEFEVNGGLTWQKRKYQQLKN